MPDFRDYYGQSSVHLAHSAKGSSWVKHKYVKVIDGIYYYPIGYEGGRQWKGKSTENKAKVKELEKKKKVEEKKAAASSEKKSKDKKEVSEKAQKRKERVKRLANEVISGKYGVGDARKTALGKKYNKVQHRVNVVLLGRQKANEIRSRKGETTTKTKKVSSTSSKEKTKKTNSKKKKKS